ncbi:MAG TPA: hypothetical protein DCK95_07620 [Anaerolineaceae bacterium]|uniref:Uncharacterized protein n=1 Tax=Anaerolinea thermophila TaxID=167964 RepID=A0A101FY72_9CHLR|nr:MAG: hypothetical protein XD73_0563 [Anaerolinea thermophila]HAF62177.1 hypothetical protein [Anaerolineaceae bacterium]
MVELLQFLKEYEGGIYLVLLVVALVLGGRLYTAMQEKKKSAFSLEREVIQKKINSTIAFLVVIGVLFVGQILLVSVASVRYPGLYTLRTPTVGELPTPTDMFQAMLQMEETPEGLEQTQTAVALTGCIPGQIEWLSPLSGDEVTGSVPLSGTINVPNMGFYKYEYRLKGREDWIPIAAGNKVVVESELGGSWNTEQLQPGLYELRIVVSDNQNNLFQPCVIEVKVVL